MSLLGVHSLGLHVEGWGLLPVPAAADPLEEGAEAYCDFGEDVFLVNEGLWSDPLLLAARPGPGAA